MDEELAKLTPQLVTHLPIADSGFTEIVKAVRWWEQAVTQAPLAALMLHVRLLELIATRVASGPWPEYIRSYLRAWWVRRFIRTTLFQLAFDAVNGHERIASAEDRQRLIDFRTAMITWHGRMFNLDLQQALTALPEFVRIFPVHTSIGRRAHSLGRKLDSPATILAWRDKLAEEWELLANRLQRMRNSLAHGGPLQDRTAETVHEFAQLLAAYSLSLALEGTLEGKGISVAHDEHRAKVDAWWDSFPSKSTVADILFIP
jgi:hypothetical protein